MIIIRKAVSNNFNILPIQEEIDNVEYVYHQYLIREGDYIFNSLNGDIVKDVDEKKDKSELIQNWFMVPKDFDMNGLLYLIMQEKIRRYKPSLNTYNIFTTMSCNAKCEYCFQHGGNDSFMNDNVAKDVANYILTHTNRKELTTLAWFGGEPLVNKRAITVITRILRNNSINFRSTITTNGDLFNLVTDGEIYLWNLKKAQFTIDIRGEEYDRVKGLPSGAYERLKNTVKRAGEYGIRAQIRVHYHPEYGLDAAKAIVDDFKSYPNVFMYPAVLYGTEKDPKEYEDLVKLEDYMVEAGVLKINPAVQLKPSNCMADDSGIRCIRVDGTLTPCEHYSEGEQYGTIYSDVYDEAMLKRWKNKRKYTNKCYDCPLFPLCEILDNCPATGLCEDGYPYYRIEQIKRALRRIQ